MKTPGSGRKKGTANKNSAPLEEKAKELGIDPFEILLLFAKGDWKALGYRYEASGDGYVIKPEVRAKCASDACKYLYPQKKALEVSTEADKSLQVVIKDYTSK